LLIQGNFKEVPKWLHQSNGYCFVGSNLALKSLSKEDRRTKKLVAGIANGTCN